MPVCSCLETHSVSLHCTDGGSWFLGMASEVREVERTQCHTCNVTTIILPPQSISLQAAYNTIVSTEWFGIRINWQGHSRNCAYTMLWQCSLWDQGILRRYNNEENLLQTREDGKDCSKNTAVWRFRCTEFADRSWISDQMSALVVSKIHVSNVPK